MKELHEHLRQTAVAHLREHFVQRTVQRVQREAPSRWPTSVLLPCSSLVLTLLFCAGLARSLEHIPRTVDLPADSAWVRLLALPAKIKPHL